MGVRYMLHKVISFHSVQSSKYIVSISDKLFKDIIIVGHDDFADIYPTALHLQQDLNMIYEEFFNKELRSVLVTLQKLLLKTNVADIPFREEFQIKDTRYCTAPESGVDYPLFHTYRLHSAFDVYFYVLAKNILLSSLIDYSSKKQNGSHDPRARVQLVDEKRHLVQIHNTILNIIEKMNGQLTEDSFKNDSKMLKKYFCILAYLKSDFPEKISKYFSNRVVEYKVRPLLRSFIQPQRIRAPRLGEPVFA